MKQIDALKELAEKVEAGDHIAAHAFVNAFYNREVGRVNSALANEQGKEAIRAYNGSLDAAHSLHKAIIPDWVWQVEETIEGWRCVVESPMNVKFQSVANFDSAARSWLLAIIKAKISELEV